MEARSTVFESGGGARGWFMHPLNILYCKPAYIRDDFISRFNYRKVLTLYKKNPQTKKRKRKENKKPRDCNENKDFSASM